MRYKGGVPPLMIYTLTRGDMPLLSQWIKKFQVRRLGIFCHSCPKKNWLKTEDFYNYITTIPLSRSSIIFAIAFSSLLTVTLSATDLTASVALETA